MYVAWYRRIGFALIAVAALCTAGITARADVVLSDFDAAPVGSYNPRADWTAFGAGTLDRGIISDGSSGNAAYHSVDWASSSWGIGNKELYRDLSAYDGIRVDARLVGVSGHTGVGPLRLSLNQLDGTEWSTPTQNLTSTYDTYTFLFNTLTRTAGSGALDLADAQIKFIVEKNGQGGTARFDFDKVIGIESGSSAYELTPVMLNPPPDGDAVRAMWMYPGTKFDSAAESQAVLDFCAREGVNQIYFGGYSIWALGTPELRDRLRHFVETAHASGIVVEAMMGETDWQDEPANVRSKVDFVIDMNAATPGNALDDFDAIHFDVEFWLDDTWDVAGNEAGRRPIAINFLDNVLVNTRNHLDANGEADMEISVALSAHLEGSGKLPSAFSYDGSTQYFIQHVLDHTDTVVIMSYIDYATGLLGWTDYELDRTAEKGQVIQLGADIQPVPPALPINSFADNGPTAFSAMTTVLEDFHTLLTPARAAALEGFCVFHYDGYVDEEPSPRNIADLDGDGDADLDDYARLAADLAGPGMVVDGLASDCDLNQDDEVSLYDAALMQQCFTGAGVFEPIPNHCHR